MFRSLFFVLFIYCGGLSAAETNSRDKNKKKPECEPNEVLNECVGCPPEDSCYDRDQYLCPAILPPCSVECVCKEGFIRKTQDSECIPKEECGVPCNIYEEYTDCKQCSNETCSSIMDPVQCDSEVPCTPGCVCWDGLYRKDENSLCLPQCSCPEMENSPDCQLSWYNPHKYGTVLG